MPACIHPGRSKSKTKVSFRGPLPSEDQSEKSQKEGGGNVQIQRFIRKDTPSQTHFSPKDTFLSQIIHFVHPYIKKRIWETSKRPNTPKHPDPVRGGIVILAQVKVSIKEKMAKTHLQSTPDLVQGGVIYGQNVPNPNLFPTPLTILVPAGGGHPKYGQYFVFDRKLTPVLPLVLTRGGHM